MANEVRIRTSVKDDASRPLKDIQDSFERFKKAGVEGVAIGASAAITTKAFDLLGNAIGHATDFMADAVKGAIEEEAGVARLGATLRANIPAWDGNTDAIERGIAARVNLGFEDDALRESMNKLIPITRDVALAQRVQAAAMDLARFKGMDLVDASLAIGKAMSGNKRMLKELGIATSDAGDAMSTLGEVEKVVSGQAAAFAETTAGRIETARAKIASFQDDLGVQVVDAATTAGTALDYLTFVFANGDSGAKSFDESVQMFGRHLQDAADQAAATAAVIQGDLYTATTKSADSIGELNQMYRGSSKNAAAVASNTQAVADANARAAKGFQKVRDDARDAAKRLQDIKSAAKDARDALVDAAFGPQETRLSLEKAKLEGKNLADELQKLERKQPTRDVRIDILDTRLAIIDNKKAVLELQGDLTTLGKTSLQQHTNTILGLKDDWGQAKSALDAYLRSLAKVPGVRTPDKNSGDGGGGGKQIPTAAGGPRSPYSTLLVGENGPEIMHLGAQGATVNPSASTWDGSAGGSITINVSTPVMTPGAAQAMADAIAPHITRWQQARGL